MDHATHNKIVSFIWSIADDCLRDVFVRGKYRDVILPMFVLRRIDCLLEETKDTVLAEVKFQKTEAKMAILDPDGLREASGQVFYNTSKFTLKGLLGNPSQLEANFNHYLDGFSDNVAEIIAKFDLRNQIRKMGEADALHGVIEKFVAPDINLSHHDAIGPDGRKLPGLTNLGMGYVFEELIRKFNEENNEEAGEHFTPREVIQLMVHLLFEPVKKKLPPVITIYDPACGSGGMLTEAQDFILDPEGSIRSKAAIYLYGKEVNPETYAICKSDMMIKGNNPENIRYGSTLATDEFSGLRFDFMLSNPPYGKSWKTDQGQILEKNGANTVIIDPRFEVRLPDASGKEQTVSAAPAVDDGQLLFLMEMASKMKRLKDSPAGSRIATVHNGSALFTGNAGGGASNIRQYLIENDLLEAIIQLPNNIFYNTGITTYIWLLSNKKTPGRKGKVQLIDASQLFEKLRKNLGAKNCAFTGEHISQITRAYLDLLDTGKQSVDGLKSQVFDNQEFGYWKVTVERPLRKSAQFTAERIAPLRFDKSLATEMEWIFSQWGDAAYQKDFLAGKKDALQRWLDHEQIELTGANLKKLLDAGLWLARRELLEIAEKLLAHFGDLRWNDFTRCTEEVKSALRKLKLKPSASQLKQLLDAVSWRDPAAEPEGLLKALSKALTAEFGKGFSLANLKNFRKFYLTFPDREKSYTLCSLLTWSHIGTAARGKHGEEIIAKGIAAEIATRRKQEGRHNQRTAYLVHSLKHPKEVKELRRIYPRGFYLIGVHAHPDRRKSHLVNTRKMTAREAVSLMARDKKEGEKHGQQVNDTFHLADFFVGWGGDDDLTLEDFFADASAASEPSSAKPNAKRVASSINRFIDLIFGDPFKTPAFGEYAMYLAFSASLRSADLSRQVGAVIAREGEILSTGANDCPKAGGGLYWPEYNADSGEFEDMLDGRDYMRNIDEDRRGYDSNRFEQDQLIATLRSMAVKAKIGAEALAILNEVFSNPQNPIRNLTEYGRVVHAEMEALLACARKGISTKGATIYCTTFPCHNCAKHLIAAGIDRVVFIEPYLKSKAFEFHREAIGISYPQNRKPGKRKPDELVQFEPFFGVGPRRFFDLFSMSLGSGEPVVRKIEATGERASWPVGQFQPRSKMEPLSYVDHESAAAQEFQEVVQTAS